MTLKELKQFRKRVAATGMRHNFIAQQVGISDVWMSYIHTNKKEMSAALKNKFEAFFIEQNV